MKRNTLNIFRMARPSRPQRHEDAIRWLMAFFVLNFSAWSAVPSVHSTHREWSATGDFDGDGLTDWALVDQKTGHYRIAYQTAPEQVTWTEARSGGAQDVTGVSVGDVLDAGKDAILLTSPLVNRIQLLDLSQRKVPAFPLSLHIPSVGPVHVVAQDIGGTGNTMHDDVWIFSSGNGPASPFRQTSVRSSGSGVFSTLIDASIGRRVIQANRIELKPGGLSVVSSLVDMGGSVDFQLRHFATGTGALVDELIGLPSDIQYTYEAFRAGAPSQVLLYQPSDPRLFVAPLMEPSPGSLKFDAMLEFDLSIPIEEIVTLQGNPPRMLVIHKGRLEASVFDFDGVNAPQLSQSFQADPGNAFTSVGGIGNGQMLLLSGAAGTGVSSQFRHWVDQGGKYVEKDAGFLKPLNAFAASANVFVFQSEPFVNANPVLLQSFNAGQWTSDLLLAGAPPQVKVQTEQYLGPSKGLGQASVASLGQVDASAQFGLPNQVSDAISLFSFRPAVGDEVVEVQSSPASGSYAKAIEVTLTASDASAQVYYRTANDQSWILYSTPIVLFKNTQLTFYGQIPPSHQKSPIQTARYTFTDTPSDMDSDLDGVPDFVELGLDADGDGTPDYQDVGEGLDPVTGSDDSDGDGYSDLSELIAGTNPYDAASFPPGEGRLEFNAGFDLIVEPLPIDGTIPDQTSIAKDETIHLYDLAGSVTGSAATAENGSGDMVATFGSVTANVDKRLLVVATEANYDIDTAGADKSLGREMMVLVPVPRLETELEVNDGLGNGDPATEASEWITAAQAAQAALTTIELETELTVEDTLVALMVEKKVSDILKARGELAEEDTLSLFSYRALDAERKGINESDWLSLEFDLDEANSGYRIDAILAGLDATIMNPPTNEVTQLIALAEDVYRISSALSNDNEGTYLSPISVLRTFLEAFELDEAYQAQTTLDTDDLVAAAAGCIQLLELDIARPRSQFTLSLQPGLITDTCTILDDNGQTYSLVYPDGSAYLLPEAFLLPAGSAFEVEAFTDQPMTDCQVDALEVIDIQLVSVPAASIADTDGDGLPDAYECFFLGGIHGMYGADHDGDGVSNGQEYEDGTDPSDADSFDPASIGLDVLPPPPVFMVTYLGDNRLSLDYVFPEVEADHLTIEVFQSDTLGGSYSHLPVTPVLTGPDQWRVTLDDPGAAQQFYRVEMIVAP